MKFLTTVLTVLSLGLHAQVAPIFDEPAKYEHLRGVVLLQEGPTITFEGCYGNLPTGEKYASNTSFNIGSISKQFTAAAILTLVNEGILDLHSPINDYLGKYAQKRWRRITVHQLLTHTSGIPSLYQTEQGLPLVFPKSSAIELSVLIRHFQAGKLLFSPGEEFSYSNSGYILLAAIIEQVTGQEFAHYIQEHLFSPAGLAHTQIGVPIGAAKPYFGYQDDQLQVAPQYHYSWMIGAGGIYSTANDLLQWLSYIQSPHFLAPELQTTYLTPHVKAGNSQYGYGWQVNKQGIRHHDGATAGFIAYVGFNPSIETRLVILTNRSFEDIHAYGKSVNYIQGLANNTWKVLTGQTVDILPQRIDQRVTLEGTFATTDQTKITIQAQGSYLEIQGDAANPARLISNRYIVDSSSLSQNLLQASHHLANGRYWKLAKFCDREMAFVCRSGLMRIGFHRMKKKVGGLVSLHPFELGENYALLRMTGQKRVLDLIVYLDTNGCIQGIFEEAMHSLDQSVTLRAYPIDENEYYLDGWPIGEQGAKLLLENGRLLFTQNNRTIVLYPVVD